MVLRDELAWFDGTEQGELVRAGDVTALELVQSAIERIESVNPALNAVVTPMFDQAMERAREGASDARLDGVAFPGVPFLLKDIGATCAGATLTCGSAFLKDFVPKRDNELVARYKRAGLIIVGKTSTPEFGLLPVTEPALFGATRNPWDPSRTPGGSSGGTAAAVASGMVPMGHGNDGGGSIRVPASCSGLFGLKPTRARNPYGPSLGDIMGGLTCEHALTRSVRDSAALLDATAGPMPGDPYWAPPPKRAFADEVGASPGRLRIAFTTSPPAGTAIHPDCVEATLEAARLCESLGHIVEEKAPPLDGEALLNMFITIYTAGTTWDLDGVALATGRKLAPEHFEPLTWHMAEQGRGVSAGSYLLTLTAVQAMARKLAAYQEDYDLLLNPTLSQPPVPIGYFDYDSSDPEDFQAFYERVLAFLPFTPVCNLSGQPAMSVPLHWNEEGLPIGVHFVARFGEEDTLFRLASQLEQARPWAHRRPPAVAG